jgi:hypothetical protein
MDRKALIRESKESRRPMGVYRVLLVRRRLPEIAPPLQRKRSLLFLSNVTIFQPMTKSTQFFAVLLVLCIAYATLAQSTPTGERSWPSFWRQFTLAINKKDHAALLRVMPNDFFDGGGGLSPKEWLQFIDKNERNGSWRDLRRSVAGGARINRSRSKGVPTKVTRDNGYYFEFRKDGKWYFAGVVGD